MEGVLLFLMACAVSVILGYTFEAINRRSDRAEKRELEKKITPEDRAWKFSIEARKYSDEKEYIEAIENYGYAINHFPKALYYNNRGFCWDELGNSTRALSDYSKAIELEPKNTTYRLNRALIYKSLNQYELACSDWEIAEEGGAEEASNYLRKYRNVKQQAAIKNLKIKSKDTPSKVAQKKPNYAHNSSNPNEKWKPIAGYNEKYWISTRGRVESVWDEDNPKILVTDNQRGWPRASLYRDIGYKREVTRRSVAYLVAESFIKNPHNYKCIDFIDGDFDNVSLDNITWVKSSYVPPYEETPEIRTYIP